MRDFDVGERVSDEDGREGTVVDVEDGSVCVVWNDDIARATWHDPDELVRESGGFR